MPQSQAQPSLPLATMVTLQEAHAYFDSDRDGRINVAELPLVLRAAGFALTQEDVDLLKKVMEVRHGGLLTLPGLVSFTISSVCPRVPLLSEEEALGEVRGVRRWCLGGDAPASPGAWGSVAAETHGVLRARLTRSGDRLSAAEFVDFLRLEAPPRFRPAMQPAGGRELLGLLGGGSPARSRR